MRSLTREEIHRLVAQVLGAMSLALVRPLVDPAPVVVSWVADLRRAADALEARLRAGAKR